MVRHPQTGWDNGAVSDYNDVPVEVDSIKLGQFLKLANLIESGGEAKPSSPGSSCASTARSRPGAAVSSSSGDVVSVAAKAARCGRRALVD